jgi:hypothetical protein
MPQPRRFQSCSHSNQIMRYQHTTLKDWLLLMQDAGGQMVSTTRLTSEFGATQTGTDYTWPDSDPGFAGFVKALQQVRPGCRDEG